MNDLATINPARLQPGPELDALIARKWMRWHLSSENRWAGQPAMRYSYKLWLVGRSDRPTGYDTTAEDGFFPSTNSAHAGKARVQADGWNIHTFNSPKPTTVSCEILVGDEAYLGWCKYQECNGYQSRTEALATCRAIVAALKAVEATKEDV